MGRLAEREFWVRTFLALYLLWFLESASTARADFDLQPAKTWVFAVGVLEWQHPDVWPGMQSAKVNRRDVQLIQHFRKAGVPEHQIVYLQDRHATRLQIHAALDRQLSQTRPGDLLIFYYAGHGFRDHENHEVFFANYDAADGDSAWSAHSIVDALEKGFRGQHVLLMPECCFSGGLAEAAVARKGRLSYGYICSAYSHNTSTGRWTFTDVLLDGLRGHSAVDLDSDGHVELEELGRHIELEMGFIEEQKSIYGRTQNFPQRLRLAAAQGRRQPGVGDRIEVQWRGQWYRAKVLEVRGPHTKIHYVNDDDSWDEWVGPDRRRAYRPRQFPDGAKVQALWGQDQKWYPASVVRGWYGLHFVHYDGDTDEWNEWIAPSAIRPAAGR